MTKPVGPSGLRKLITLIRNFISTTVRSQVAIQVQAAMASSNIQYVVLGASGAESDLKNQLTSILDRLPIGIGMMYFSNASDVYVGVFRSFGGYSWTILLTGIQGVWHYTKVYDNITFVNLLEK